MRKLYSIFLCICLLLTTMPANIFAASDANLPEGLYWAWKDEAADLSVPLRTDIQGGYPGRMDMVFIYLDASGVRNPLKCSELTSSGSYFRLRDDREVSEGVIGIHYLGEGTGGSISYTNSAGTKFSINVDSEFWVPEYAFYRAPSINAQNFIDIYSGFEFDGTNNTFYLIPAHGFQITGCRVVRDLRDVVSVSEDAANGYWVLTINDPDASGSLDVRLDGIDTEGKAFSDWGDSLDILNTRPGLFWRWPETEWKDGEEILVPGENERLRKEMEGYPYGTSYREFVFKDENGDLHPVKVEDLTFDGSFYQLNPLQEYYAALICDGLGEETISYNGYSLKIKCTLPAVGLYSSPTISEDTFLQKWNYDGSNGTAYLLAKTGYSLSNVKIRNQNRCTASLSGAGGGQSFEVNLQNVETHGVLEFEYEVTKDAETYTDDFGIRVFDVRPRVIKETRTMKDSEARTVDLTVEDVGGTLSITVDGDVSASAPVLVADYDESGRFVGLTLVKESGRQAAVSSDAEMTKVLWVDASFVPKSAAEAIAE